MRPTQRAQSTERHGQLRDAKLQHFMIQLLFYGLLMLTGHKEWKERHLNVNPVVSGDQGPKSFLPCAFLLYFVDSEKH